MRDRERESQRKRENEQRQRKTNGQRKTNEHSTEKERQKRGVMGEMSNYYIDDSSVIEGIKMSFKLVSTAKEDRQRMSNH